MTFIEQTLIFTLAAIVILPISQKLGLGSVLGYLLAGVLIGPYGLKLIDQPESVAHFSELGVVFLLFLIGLEIQPRKLWSMRRHLVGLGGSQIALCTLVFAGLALGFGLSLTSSCIVGFALSLSSTAFAVQTLIEKKIFHTEFGRGSFSALLMQDLTAIPALAVIPWLVPEPSTNRSLVMMILLTIGTFAFFIFASRFLMRPLFRIIAGSRSRDLFIAVTLFIVMGVATWMQKIGLSAALGAFVAGVLFADSEYRHELEINIEPFKALLMGLFFMAVGLGVHVDLLIQQPLTLLGAALGYLLIKGALIFAVGRGFGFTTSNAKMMALSIAQGGEFAFVIFGLVAGLRLLDANHLAWLTAVITLSMALSPLSLLAEEQWRRYCARKQKAQVEYDTIPDEAPEVIIAGYGRVGQIFGRILSANDIPHVGIDHDPNQIELLRRFGRRVYYGDASRSDLLETAGAARAKYFVLAIDDVESSLATARMVKENFPNLTIYARARNRGHAFDLMALGVSIFQRETFEGSLTLTGQLLIDMGFDVDRTARMLERFRKHDEAMLREQFKVRDDDKTMISVSKQGSEQLASVLREDTAQSYIS